MPSPFRTFVLRVMFGVMFLAENSVIALSARQQFVKEKQRSGAPVIQTIDLGQDKLIDIFVGNGNNRSRKRSADVALARLIAHCPSFVDDLNVLELGCGFGLASAAASKHARPNHIALTDYDAHNLKRAYTSVTQLHRSKASVSRCIMNWADKTTWPNQNYDILLGSDVLREEGGFFLWSMSCKIICAVKVEATNRNVPSLSIPSTDRIAMAFAMRLSGLGSRPTQFPFQEWTILF